MKPLLLLICMASAICLTAQRSKVFYFDSHWSAAKAKEAFYLVEQSKISDTCWEWNYYRVGRPRLRSVKYLDKNGTVPHGEYIIYRKDGNVDTFGYYKNGKRDYLWHVMASNNRVLKEIHYTNGVILSEIDSTQMNAEREKMQAGKSVDTSGAFDKVEIESEFAGGDQGWRLYLMKSLRYPPPAIDMEAQGETVIQFIVNKVGKIEQPSLIRSVEYHLDKEAMRMIIESPAWTPAIQDGKNVKSYKKQPIIFRLERG